MVGVFGLEIDKRLCLRDLTDQVIQYQYLAEYNIFLTR